MMFLVGRKPPEVPETDIQDVIKIVNDWLENHPEREDCCPAIFGHKIWKVRRGYVRAAAVACDHAYTTAGEKADKYDESRKV